jgi:hypothetical protein
MQQENVITLDNTNSIKIITQYIELSQQKGVFLLSEAELLKRAVDVCNSNVSDAEINISTAKNLLVQGIIKSQQKGGVFSLTDAALLHKVVTFIEANIHNSQQQQPSQTVQQPSQTVQQPKIQTTIPLTTIDDDLSDLSNFS